jgi:DNA polymerase III sliding clamp (beta) subunit (PCNA family)
MKFTVDGDSDWNEMLELISVSNKALKAMTGERTIGIRASDSQQVEIYFFSEVVTIYSNFFFLVEEPGEACVNCDFFTKMATIHSEEMEIYIKSNRLNIRQDKIVNRMAMINRTNDYNVDFGDLSPVNLTLIKEALDKTSFLLKRDAVGDVTRSIKVTVKNESKLIFSSTDGFSGVTTPVAIVHPFTSGFCIQRASINPLLKICRMKSGMWSKNKGVLWIKAKNTAIGFQTIAEHEFDISKLILEGKDGSKSRIAVDKKELIIATENHKKISEANKDIKEIIGEFREEGFFLKVDGTESYSSIKINIVDSDGEYGLFCVSHEYLLPCLRHFDHEEIDISFFDIMGLEVGKILAAIFISSEKSETCQMIMQRRLPPHYVRLT